MTASATELLKAHDSSLNAASFNTAAEKAGILRKVNYESTTGSGQIKSFYAITDDFSKYGVNEGRPHEFKTAPRFFIESFPELLIMVCDQLVREIKR